MKNKRKILIKKIIKRYCEELKIPLINVEFNKSHRISFRYVYYKSDCTIFKKFIRIDEYYLFDMILHPRFNDSLWKFIPLKSVRDRLRFIIGHELGHYLHSYLHPKHYVKNMLSYNILNKIVNDRDYSGYRNSKLEKIADKIGLYLVKKGF